LLRLRLSSGGYLREQHVTNQLERELHRFTIKEQKWFSIILSITMIRFKASSEKIGIQELWTEITMHMIYPMSKNSSGDPDR